jgi:hypothetical protein
MIGIFLLRSIVAISLIALVSAGWACGLSAAVPVAHGKAATAAPSAGAASAAHEMQDCHRSATPRHEPAPQQDAQPCLSLCAVTVQSITASVSRPLNLYTGEPHYPASASLHSWSTQPDPFPPRV